MNTVLVTNSRATRWMLRRIWRPSATIPGTTREVVADEHEVGDRARHLRAGALGDRQARLLQRGDVVDAVADHRDVATGVGQRGHDRALALGRDPPDGGRGERPPRADAAGLGRQRLAVERRRRARHAGVARDRADGRGRVAGEHLELDLLGGEERDRLGRVRPQPLGEHHEAERPARRRGMRLGVGRRAAASRCVRARARAARRPPPRARARRAPGRASANRSGAPSTSRSSPRSSALQRRREENGTWATTRRCSTSARWASAIAWSVRLRDGALAA